MIKRFSKSLKKLIHVTAYLKRFSNNSKKNNSKFSWIFLKRRLDSNTNKEHARRMLFQRNPRASRRKTNLKNERVAVSYTTSRRKGNVSCRRLIEKSKYPLCRQVSDIAAKKSPSKAINYSEKAWRNVSCRIASYALCLASTILAYFGKVIRKGIKQELREILSC